MIYYVRSVKTNLTAVSLPNEFVKTVDTDDNDNNNISSTIRSEF